MKITKFVWRLPLLLAALFVSIYAHAQTKLKLPEGVQYVTTVEGITEYRLANGLQVLLFPDMSKPIVTVNITYKVGSRHEDYGETGMAHLLEHLVFKGTPKHPNIPQELTEHGARPNGTTSFDRTNYFETFDATDVNLRWALDLESDRMVNSYIARKDLESEFSVVRNEYERGENSPGSVLYKRMMATAFNFHNYGHSTIGEKSDIEKAPIERLQAFYRKYYQPDNALLLIAGKFDEQKTLDMVHEYFSPIPRPERQLVNTYTEEPTQDGERMVTLRRVGDVQVFSAMYRSCSGAHPDYAALSVLSNILTDEPTGRLYKALVESKKAVAVYGGASGFAEGGVTRFVTEVRADGSLDSASQIMLAVLEDLKTNGPTEEEIDKAKVRLLKNQEMFFKESSRVGLSLSNFVGTGDWRLAFFYRDQLEKVTREDVMLAVAKYFKSANRTLGTFIPDKNPDRSEIPATPNLAELLKDYKGKAPMAQGEDFDPTPENLEKRTTRKTLPNGMKYALLPKETRGDVVTVSISLNYGTLETAKGKSTIGDFTAAMLDKGTATKNREQLKEALDKLKARVNFFGGANGTRVVIDTDREHLPDVIRLVGEILRKPAFPQNEFDKMKQEQLAGIEETKTDPTALAYNTFSRISTPPYPKDDPRYTETFDEQLASVKAVTLDQVKTFYKDFYGASDGTAAIVGDFDVKATETALKEVFGDWKTPVRYQRYSTDYKPVTPRTEEINTPDKANAAYVAGYGFAMRSDDPEYAAVELGGYMLGGGFLNSRLATRIRQKEGLSYTVRGSFSASDWDQNASFSSFMIYNPENLSKIEAAFKEEIERASNEGFTAAELDAAKSGWLSSQKVNRSGDSYVAGTLNYYLELGRDFSWNANKEKAVSELNTDKVNKAIKKHLDYSKMIVVKAGDFKKPAKP